MADKPYSKTRIVQSPAHSGKWVVQGWWPSTQVWADVGDPCDSFDEALAKERQVETDHDPDWSTAECGCPFLIIESEGHQEGCPLATEIE